MQRIPPMTTLTDVRAIGPCPTGWRDILRANGQSVNDDSTVYASDLLDAVGLEQFVYGVRAVSGYEAEMRAYAYWCVAQTEIGGAKMVLPIPIEEVQAQLDRDKTPVASAARRAARHAMSEDIMVALPKVVSFVAHWAYTVEYETQTLAAPDAVLEAYSERISEATERAEAAKTAMLTRLADELQTRLIALEKAYESQQRSNPQNP